MTPKIGHIYNPLTIIAIFAGIAEISGTVILPSLSEENQSIFMLYVMFFPIFQISSFFYILWNKREILYAPKDFQNEQNFINTLQGSSLSVLNSSNLNTTELNSNNNFDNNKTT